MARLEAYLSRSDVQKAIHVPQVDKRPAPWKTRAITYARSAEDLLLPSARSYPALIARLSRVLIYSGDFDAQVPHSATEQWTRGLGIKVEKEWMPWHVDGFAAGNVVQYAQNFTYATVRGAGHQAPMYRPEASIALFRRFLAGHEI